MHGNMEKLKSLIAFIAAHPKVAPLGKTKLFKLLYFIDAEALRTHGASITESEYIKYEHGPVPGKGEKALKRLAKDAFIRIEYREFPGYAMNVVVPENEYDLSALTPDEIAIAESVITKHGDKSASALSEMSHLEPAYLYAHNLGVLDADLMAYSHSEDPEGL